MPFPHSTTESWVRVHSALSNLASFAFDVGLKGSLCCTVNLLRILKKIFAVEVQCQYCD